MILSVVLHALLAQASQGAQEPLTNHAPPQDTGGIGSPLLASLERLARLVDTTYCLGSTGIHQPFDCLSRCKDFPELTLVTTWSTGVLLGDNCGFIALDGGAAGAQGAIVVAFRGTYSIASAVDDLLTAPQKYVPYAPPDAAPGAPPHSCDNCTVHTGFLYSWQNARAAVLQELQRQRAAHPGLPVHVIGHSLGGAVACFAALDLRVSLGWDDVVVTTFGEPRAGNGQFARYVDDVFALGGDADPERRGSSSSSSSSSSSYRRVTHTGDIVPLLPSSELGFRSHAGEVFISKTDLAPAEGDLLLCSGDDDPRCSAGEDGSVLRGGPGRLVARGGSGGGTPGVDAQRSWGLPPRMRPWEILLAHRDYFWRLGLCIPGGDPSDWGRPPYSPKPRDSH